MDDLILAGVLSIIGFSAAAVLAVAAVVFTLMELYIAAEQGNTGRVEGIIGIILLVFTAYAGTGFWLKWSGRI